MSWISSNAPESSASPSPSRPPPDAYEFQPDKACPAPLPLPATKEWGEGRGEGPPCRPQTSRRSGAAPRGCQEPCAAASPKDSGQFPHCWRFIITHISGEEFLESRRDSATKPKVVPQGAQSGKLPWVHRIGTSQPQ